MSNEKTHWLSNPNKNFIGHWDLPEGKDLVLTIKSAGFENVENPQKSRKDNPHIEVKKVVRWIEDYKPLIVNATNSENLYRATGVRNMEDSIGKRVTLYVAKEKFRFSSEKIDCIRVRKKAPSDKIPSKPAIGPKRFSNALEVIKKKEYTKKELLGEFILNKEQQKQLDEI